MAQAMEAKSASKFDAARISELDRLAAGLRPGWEHASGPHAIKKPAALGAAGPAEAVPPPPPSQAPTVRAAVVSEIEAEELLPNDLVTDPMQPPGPPGAQASAPPPAPAVPQPVAVAASAPRPVSFPPPRAAVPSAPISSPSITDELPAIRGSKKPLVIGLAVSALVAIGLVVAFRSGSGDAAPTNTTAATATGTPASTGPEIPPPPAATDTPTRSDTVAAKPADTTPPPPAPVAPPPVAAATTPPPTSAPAAHAAPPSGGGTPHSAITPPAPHPAHAAPHGGSGGGASKPPSKGSGGIVRDVPF